MGVYAGTYALHSSRVLHSEEATSIAIRHHNYHSKNNTRRSKVMSVPCDNFLLMYIGQSMGFSKHSGHLFSSEMEYLLVLRAISTQRTLLKKDKVLEAGCAIIR
jgi:hypothetical protein